MAKARMVARRKPAGPRTLQGGASVAKPEWGAKHICHNCGTRFYDMHRAEIVCPKCNTTFDPEALLKSRRSRGGFTGDVTPVRPSRSRAKAPAEVEAPAAEEEEEPVGGGDEEAAEEDTDLESIESGEEEFEEGEDEESGVLLEDASELGDDDVEIDVEDRDEESR
jgi:uncharacterized protein (TIGR02300 family)